MEKLYIRAASTMNYLFLRAVVGKEKICGVMKEEMCLFFEAIAESEKVDDKFYELIKTEMNEGGYLEDRSLSEFMDKVAFAIRNIMGEVNEEIYNLYTYIAGTIAEENDN